MGLVETAIVYLVLGAVVAGAMWLQAASGQATRWSVPLWLVCWPLFAPTLFAGVGIADAACSEAAQERGPAEDLSERIAVAERMLEQKLADLQGAAAASLTHETGRIRQLQRALESMALRVSQMDSVLTTPEFDEAQAALRVERRAALTSDAADPALGSLQARLSNIRQLKELRSRMYVQIERALFRIEEMGSRLALLRFAEGQAGGAESLIDEISGTIDDITDAIVAVA